MSDHKERVRKVDVNQMTISQVEQLQKQLATEMAKIMDEANTKCNQMLNIYGLQSKINYQIVQIAEKTEKKPKISKRMKKDVKAQSLSKLQE
jgi:hypothetical protein